MSFFRPLWILENDLNPQDDFFSTRTCLNPKSAMAKKSFRILLQKTVQSFSAFRLSTQTLVDEL